LLEVALVAPIVMELFWASAATPDSNSPTTAVADRTVPRKTARLLLQIIFPPGIIPQSSGSPVPRHVWVREP
jgi:hypothetical protein